MKTFREKKLFSKIISHLETLKEKAWVTKNSRCSNSKKKKERNIQIVENS